MKTIREITKNYSTGTGIAGEVEALLSAAKTHRKVGNNVAAAKLEGRVSFLKFWAESAGMTAPEAK